jgi:hypothetical protein
MLDIAFPDTYNGGVFQHLEIDTAPGHLPWPGERVTSLVWEDYHGR